MDYGSTLRALFRYLQMKAFDAREACSGCFPGSLFPTLPELCDKDAPCSNKRVNVLWLTVAIFKRPSST